MNKNKKSFSEYMEYLLFEKKLLNTKTAILLVFLIGVIAIAGLKITLKPSLNEDGEVHFDNDYRSELLEEFGYSKSELEEMNEEEKINLSNTILIKTRNQVAGDEWKDEFSKESYHELKMEYYKYAIAGEYDNIVNNFESLKMKHYFSSPYNKKIIQIYNDAYAIKSAFSDKNNIVQQKDTLTKLNDERMLLSALLQSDLETRNSVIKDRMSLTFSSEDKPFRVNSVNSASMGYMAKNNMHIQDANLRKLFEYLNEGNYIIYKINFSLEADNFNAYIYKDSESMNLNVFGIYAENESLLNNAYNTIAETDEILSNLENYQSTIEENIDNY